MIRRPPRSTRTDTLFPYTTLFRSPVRPSTMRVWASSSMRVSLRVSVRPASPGLSYFIKDQQSCAARDGNVRHIERREIPVVPVKQYKNDNIPMHHSIEIGRATCMERVCQYV